MLIFLELLFCCLPTLVTLFLILVFNISTKKSIVAGNVFTAVNAIAFILWVEKYWGKFSFPIDKVSKIVLIYIPTFVTLSFILLFHVSPKKSKAVKNVLIIAALNVFTLWVGKWSGVYSVPMDRMLMFLLFSVPIYFVLFCSLVFRALRLF